jgi:hypothetical protein
MQYTQYSRNSLIVKHLRRAGPRKSLIVKDLRDFGQALAVGTKKPPPYLEGAYL